MSGSRFHVGEPGCWIHDVDVLKRTQYQQVLIASDDMCRPPVHGHLKHRIIIRIATDLDLPGDGDELAVRDDLL